MIISYASVHHLIGHAPCGHNGLLQLMFTHAHAHAFVIVLVFNFVLNSLAAMRFAGAEAD